MGKRLAMLYLTYPENRNHVTIGNRNRFVGLWMLYKSLEDIHWIERTIHDIGYISFFDENKDEKGNINATGRKALLSDFRHLLGYAKDMPITDMVYMLEQRFIPHVSDMEQQLSSDNVQSFKERLYDSLSATISAHKCLILSKSESEQFEQWEDGWTSVSGKWGELSYDIKESSRCLATERSTATVFHLMRVLEKGAQLFANSLGITAHNGRPINELTIKEVSEALDQKITELSNPQNGQKKDKAFVGKICEAKMNLFACKEAWRNPVMHPTSTWTVEDAIDIYDCTKKFMNFLVEIT